MLLTIMLNDAIDDEGIDYLTSEFPLCGKDKRVAIPGNSKHVLTFDITTVTSRQKMWLDLNSKVSHFIDEWNTDNQDTEATMTPAQAQETLVDAIKTLKQQDIYTGRLEQILHVLNGLVEKQEEIS